ncbi:MAG: ACT domain-containing protein [Candidatus Omnitrophota bacterium]|nr:ACT domain-containing protein [Candidatus Omnitrophota bacterium]
MKHAIITVIGKDQPGIIAGVTGILYKERLNLEDISMTILEGEFAMMLIVAIPSARKNDSVQGKLKAWQKKTGVQVRFNEIHHELKRGEKHGKGTVPHILSIVARDKTGIVYTTSQILARHGLNITDLNSKILGKGSKTLYAMLLEVDIPRNFAPAKIKRISVNLATKLKTAVELKAVERFEF